jgi:hypothetical protein
MKMQADHQTSQKIKTSAFENPLVLLLGIAFICLLAIGILIWLQRSKPFERKDAQATSQPPNQSKVLIGKPEIEQFLQSWKRTWENRDIQIYSDFYDKTFAGRNTPESSQMNLYQWIEDKRLKFQRSSNISIAIGTLTINYEGSDAVVSFLQNYRSDNYTDYGHKTLKIHKQSDGTLKIVYEDFIPVKR